LDHAAGLRGNAMEGAPEVRGRSLASDARAGATAYGGGGATRTSRPPQATPHRSPRRHAQRPRHPLYRKESIVPNNILNCRRCNLFSAASAAVRDGIRLSHYRAIKCPKLSRPCERTQARKTVASGRFSVTQDWLYDRAVPSMLDAGFPPRSCPRQKTSGFARSPLPRLPIRRAFRPGSAANAKHLIPSL
jgi:hypothetical protein